MQSWVPQERGMVGASRVLDGLAVGSTCQAPVAFETEGSWDLLQKIAGISDGNSQIDDVHVMEAPAC